MERKYAALAENILSHIGGKDNIIHMTHCVTRLRLELKDDKKADLDALNAMDGIAGTFWRGGQLQIMIGSQVKEVFAELVSCAGVPGEEPGTRQKLGQPGEKEIHIAAPVSGRVIALSQIEDEAFASGVLGQGAAILPSDGKIYAPADGTITTFFSLKEMFLHRNFAPNLRLIKMLFSSRFQRSKGGTDGRILKRKPVRYRRNLTDRKSVV